MTSRQLSRPIITAEKLRELLHYDPVTGVFTWRVDRRLGLAGNGHLVAAAGSIAGQLDPSTGYMQCHVMGRRYLMHRLAVLHVTGAWPTGEVDHEDGNRARNVWTNLRDVPHAINKQNQRRARADNKLMLQGVQFDPHGKREKRYRSRITVTGKVHRLGYFLTAEEAHEAYLTAKRRLHEGCTI